MPPPVQVHGVTQKPIEGVSMAYTFDDAKAADHHVTQIFERSVSGASTTRAGAR